MLTSTNRKSRNVNSIMVTMIGPATAQSKGMRFDLPILSDYTTVTKHKHGLPRSRFGPERRTRHEEFLVATKSASTPIRRIEPDERRDSIGKYEVLSGDWEVAFLPLFQGMTLT